MLMSNSISHLCFRQQAFSQIAGQLLSIIEEKIQLLL